MDPVAALHAVLAIRLRWDNQMPELDALERVAQMEVLTDDAAFWRRLIWKSAVKASWSPIDSVQPERLRWWTEESLPDEATKIVIVTEAGERARFACRSRVDHQDDILQAGTEANASLLAPEVRYATRRENQDALILEGAATRLAAWRKAGLCSVQRGDEHKDR